MTYNARIYAAADRYMMLSVKGLSRSKLEARLGPLHGQSMNGVRTSFNLLDITPLVEVIRILYTSNIEQSLKEALCNIIKLQSKHLVLNDGFKALLKSGLGDGDFAADAFTALVSFEDENLYYCDVQHDLGCKCVKLVLHRWA